jgi:L-rhamnose mutarotase
VRKKASEKRAVKSKAGSRSEAPRKGAAKTGAPAGPPPAHGVRRFGQLIGLRPERFAEYERYHAAVWPEILEAIRRAGIRNYSIFHFESRLFAYFEYHGPPAEYDARMRELARAPRMREWWDITDPMQLPVAGREPGEWWANMKEVFHTD